MSSVCHAPISWPGALFFDTCHDAVLGYRSDRHDAMNGIAGTSEDAEVNAK